MESHPLVSAIIPTKNRADLLPRAIDSILNQTYPNIELIVIDDGSEDNTPEIIERLSEKQSLLYIRNETSVGASRARNIGIEQGQGEFIAGLDDDDEWHPERISILMDEYEDSFSCITSDVKRIVSNKSIVWHKKTIITFDDLLFSNQVGNQVLVRRKRLVEVGSFDESLEAAQDYDLWIRLCEKFGPIKNVSKPLQNVYENADIKRISNPKSQLKGYLTFYQKHKEKMNRNQRKYQLYNIRRAQGKITGISGLVGWVPPRRIWKEIKRLIADRFLFNDR